MKVYLDNAATTPLDEKVLNAMMPFLTEKFGNPSSIHSFGRETKAAVEKARKTIAELLNASTGEIFFTSGGTESANTVFNCLIGSARVTDVITSVIEHHCTIQPLQSYADKGMVNLHYVNIDGNGKLDIKHLESLLKSIKGDTLVCLMNANNEIGNLLDINKVSELCGENKAMFFCDTVQTVAHYPFDLQKTKLQFMMGSAHKFHGPKGVGFLYINSDLKIHPFMLGGSQERNMRAGTENVPGIIGMAEAMKLAYENLEADKEKIIGLRQYFINELKSNIPDLQINGTFENSLYTVLSVAFPAHEKGEFLIYNLDINNIAVSAGSACSSGADTGSHVLENLDIEEGRKSIRFSFSKHNTKKEVDFVMGVLKEIYAVAV